MKVSGTRYGVRTILLFSLTVAAGRWVIVALCPESLLLLAQVLQPSPSAVFMQPLSK